MDRFTHSTFNSDLMSCCISFGGKINIFGKQTEAEDAFLMFNAAL